MTTQTILLELKNFDNIMSVGIGVNLALGILKGIKDSIFHFFNSYVSRKLSVYEGILDSQVQSEITTQQVAKEKIDKQRQKMSNKEHIVGQIIQPLTILFALLVSIVCLGALYRSATAPLTQITLQEGRWLVLLTTLPLLIYVVSILLLSVTNLIQAHSSVWKENIDAVFSKFAEKLLLRIKSSRGK